MYTHVSSFLKSIIKFQVLLRKIRYHALRDGFAEGGTFCKAKCKHECKKAFSVFSPNGGSKAKRKMPKILNIL